MGITLVLFAIFELVYTHLNWGKGNTKQFSESPLGDSFLVIVSVIYSVWILQGGLQAFLGFYTAEKVERGTQGEVARQVQYLKWFSYFVLAFTAITIAVQLSFGFEMAEVAKKYVKEHGSEHITGW